MLILIRLFWAKLINKTISKTKVIKENIMHDR